MLLKIAPYFLFLVSLTGGCSSQPVAGNSRGQADSLYSYRTPSADGTGKFYMQREIAHVMGAAGSDWLERNSRPQEENTELAIERMNLLPNSVVADIGAGTGYYSFKVAKKIPQGKLYAVELQDELITYLQNKKAALKDSVITVVKSTEQSPNLPDNSIDFIFMVDVYHELAYPHEMLQAIRKALRPGGRLLLMEYRGEDPAVRIKPLHKTTVSQLGRELKANGFQLQLKGDFLPIQHFLVYTKQ